MKKILAFFLAVCFLMSAFASLSVFAAEGSSVTANGSSVYSDSNEVSAAELVSVFGNLLNPNSIAKSWITSKKKAFRYFFAENLRNYGRPRVDRLHD